MAAKRLIVSWLPATLWAVAIFILSAQSRVPEIGPEFAMKDKVEHWMCYSVLAWFVALALRRAHQLTLPKTFVLAMLISSGYGATDEFHQRFVPNRTCVVADWVADTLGASAAAAAFYAYESHRSAKQNRQSA
jgi:VanZ family protein